MAGDGNDDSEKGNNNDDKTNKRQATSSKVNNLFRYNFSHVCFHFVAFIVVSLRLQCALNRFIYSFIGTFGSKFQ